MTLFKVLYYYFVLPLFPWIGRQDPELRMAREDLLNRFSFRVPESESSGYLLLIKEYVRLWRKARSMPSGAMPASEGEGGEAIFDNKAANEDLRRGYLDFFFGEEARSFIPKREILATLSFPSFFGAFSFLLLFFPLLLLRGVFLRPEQRRMLALLPREACEAYAFLRLLRKMKCQRLYQFCIFEKDANMITVLLRREGIRSSKFTSNTPLSFYNSRILADDLYLCNRYQEEEAKLLETVMILNEIAVLGPERVLDYFEKYRARPSAKRARVGLYSNGVWLREALGHPDPGIGTFQAERRLVEQLGKILEEGDLAWELMIFPHPKEKQDHKCYERSVAHWSALFDGNCKIASPDIRTPQALEEVELAVGAFSNSLMERLYCGYKTLFFVEGIDGFPLKSSPLTSICVNGKEELQACIEEVMREDEERFFAKRGLGSYTMFGGKGMARSGVQEE